MIGAVDKYPFDIEVYFDGDCPLCVREISFLRKKDKDQRILFTDISAREFDATGLEVNFDQLMAEIHGRLPDGRLIKGVEVFRRLYTAVGWGRLVAVTRWPVMAQLLDFGYRIFARNRLKLTGRCHGDTCAVPGDSNSVTTQTEAVRVN